MKLGVGSGLTATSVVSVNPEVVQFGVPPKSVIVVNVNVVLPTKSTPSVSEAKTVPLVTLLYVTPSTTISKGPMPTVAVNVNSTVLSAQIGPLLLIVPTNSGLTVITISSATPSQPSALVGVTL